MGEGDEVSDISREEWRQVVPEPAFVKFFRRLFRPFLLGKPKKPITSYKIKKNEPLEETVEQELKDFQREREADRNLDHPGEQRSGSL